MHLSLVRVFNVIYSISCVLYFNEKNTSQKLNKMVSDNKAVKFGISEFMFS